MKAPAHRMKAAVALLAVFCQLWLGIAHAFIGATSPPHEGVFCGDANPVSVQTMLAQMAPELRELASQEEDCCSNSCELCAPLFSPALAASSASPACLPQAERSSASSARSSFYHSPTRLRPPATGPPSIPASTTSAS